MVETLFIVRATNHEDGAWTQHIIAKSPGEAVDIAVKRKPWTVGEPITVDMPLDFVDPRQALSGSEKE